MNEADAESARRVSAALNKLIAGGLLSTAGGLDRAAEWEAEDGWLIGYSTARIKGGEYDGKFVVTAHRPRGKGSRSGKGNAEMWTLAYSRAFATRKAAKARALQLYRQHSPRYAARTARQTG